MAKKLWTAQPHQCKRMPHWKGHDFEPTKQGISLFCVAGQAVKCQKRKKKKAPRGPGNHVFVFSLQNKWFRDEGQTAKYKEKNASKIVRKSPLFWCQIFRTHRQKQPKTLRFKRIRRKNTFCVFWKSAQNPYKDLTRTKSTLFLRTTNRARNPFKTSAKREEGNPDTSWGPDSPLQILFFGQDSPPTAHIYICL